MKKFDQIYEEYLAAEDKTVSIGGKTYYKIILKEKVNKKISVITVPVDVMSGELVFTDEYGYVFETSAPALFAFKADGPEWHYKTVELFLKSAGHSLSFLK